MRRQICVALLALLACTPATTDASARPSVTATASATPAATADIAELNQLVTLRRDAVARGDRDAFDKTYDATRVSFAACQRELYDLRVTDGEIQRVDAFGAYYRVIANQSGGTMRFFVRRIDGTLKITEPQPSEVGETRTRSDGPVVVTYWAIDEDVASGVAAVAHRAYDFAGAQSPRPDLVPFSVQLYPIHVFTAGQPCWIAGTASISDPKHPVVNVPVYNVTFDAAFKTPSLATSAAITHEALHWVQGQVAYGATVSGPWWMLEGWPDRVASIDRSATVRRQLCVSGFPAREVLERHGIALLDRPGSIDVAGQYAAANTLVEYLVATYGVPKYWELYSAVNNAIDNDRAFGAVLGITQSDFYARWLAWVKAKYC